ncbi:MAG TPA: hypothetical protein VL400_10960 [Polyangiaceae bacterium]|nr:hypothetical protein [Polyangiaceae bacterium]
MQVAEARATESPPIPKHVRAMEIALRTLHLTGAALATLPATTFDLRPAARALEVAITSTLDAYDARRDPLAATRDAMTALDEAKAIVSRASTELEGIDPLPKWVERARGWLAVAEAAFVRTPTFAAPTREIVASVEEPPLFRIDRPCLGPVIEVAPPRAAAPPPASPLSLEGLSPSEKMAAVREHAARARASAAEKREAREASRLERAAARRKPEEEPPPGFVAGKHVALDRDALVVRRGRELFEEVVIGGLHRTPLIGDAWRTMDVVDKRIWRAIDALAALGPRAIGQIERLVVDAPAKDPARGFALAAIGGSFEGRDMLAAAERAYRFLGPADPEVARHVGAALRLTRHPDLPVMLRTWLEDDDASVRALAIDVLGHRGLATEEELGAALRSASLDVVAAAVPWATLARNPELRGAIDAHRDTDHDGLARAIGWALVMGGAQDGADRLAAMLETERETFALLPLAIAGEREHAARLVGLVQKKATSERIVALGYAGPREAIPALITVLSDREAAPDAKIAAAFALQRITGAEVYDDVDLPPEKLEAETPEDPAGLPDAKPPLRKRLSPRDQPSDGSPDRMKLPPPRPEPWQTYFEAEGHRFQGAGRFRRGQPYTPASSLLELDGYRITPDERRIAFRELVIKTGQVVPFDPLDYVATQERALDAWAPIAERASSQPGAWGRAQRR